MKSKKLIENVFKAPETCILDRGDGYSLKGEVSPCVRMYRGYPFQVAVYLYKDGKDLGHTIVVDKTVDPDNYTKDDVDKLVWRASSGLKKCKACDNLAFDPTTIETNRNGYCETCFVDELNKEFAKIDDEENEALRQRDAAARRKGAKFRLSGWVHPERGDDYQVDFWFNERPSQKKAEELLRKEGSTIMTDYEIVSIA